MTDRVYPSGKPTPTTNGVSTAAPGGATNPSFPATKAQLYNSSRPAYRPQPRRKSSRSCCCACCLWTTLIVAVILLLAAVAGAVLWVLYRPHRPTFSVSSLQISQFNVSSSSLSSKFNLTFTARNPNKKLVFYYDPISVSILADGIDVGDGSLPAFEHDTKNTTVLRTTIASTAQSVDSSAVSVLKNKNSLAIMVQIETKIKVKIGGVKTKRIGIRVKCEGIKAAVPTGKTATTAATGNAECKVDLRIKIWKWTF